MSGNPQVKVIKALYQQARVQASSADPHAKIEGALWQIFFELPPARLLELREEAIGPARQPELFNVVPPEEALRAAEE